MIIYFRKLSRATDWRWFNLHLPVIECEDSQGIVAIDADTELPVGAVVVDNITETSVQAHFMVTTPILMRHSFLEEACGYVFNGLGKDMMLVQIKDDNEASLSVTDKMGFETLIHIENAHCEGVGYIVKQLKKENCTFIPQVVSDGKEIK